MPSRRLRPLALVLAAVALVAGSGCGSGETDLNEAAKDSLVLYSGRNQNLVGPLLEQFTEATGIKVTPRYGDGAELAATLLEEGDKTPASVFFSQDAGALGALEEAGRLDPLTPAVLELVPATYRSARGFWVGVSGRARVLAYNTEQVRRSELPASVLDLVKPEYKGRVGFVPTNASFHAFVTAMRVALGEQRTKEFLLAFKANEPRAYDRNGVLAEAVDKGEIPMALLNHYYLYERADEIGGFDRLKAANHFFTAGDPGTLVNAAGVGVLKGKSDDRARRFVEFLLSKQAQTYFGTQTHEYPLISGVPVVGEDLPALDAIKGPDVDLSELDTLEATLALLDEVGLT